MKLKMALTSTYSDLFSQADKWAKENFANPGRAWVVNMWNSPRRCEFTVCTRNVLGDLTYVFQAEIRKGQIVFPDLNEHFGVTG